MHPIDKMSKQEILDMIEKKGCPMLKNKLNGSETKREIIEYLIHCKCPVIKKLVLSK